MKKSELKYYKTASFRFYAELNDFIPAGRKQKCFDYSFLGPITVKEVIESMGVPHSQVDMVLVNGEAVDFSYRINESDYISVYPVFESIDISSASKVRKEPLRHTKFILDAHLGKLAKYLRMIGFDTLYKNDYTDSTIREIGRTEHRIILTRDKGLLNSKKVTHGYYVRAIHPEEQLSEIIEKLDLYSRIDPLSRCLICNGKLKKVNKEDILEQVKPDTAQFFNSFYQCPSCNKIFWEGSHYDRMSRFIKRILSI
ncbi:MAG: Mut7-C ubiquitin/RNAse domain-containing protein [Chlorobi bacterium]|nr:Mut7-C ubiquitin/RNAse domain-containing protein [Chlorobiota bacterium]